MWEHREVMARPPSSSSQWLGTYLVIALPILLSVTRALDRYWLRVALALPILVALVALVCSYSRGAWLAVLVECVVFVFLTGRRRLTVFLIGAGLLASIALVLVLRTGYQHHTLDPETLGVRVSLWNLGVRELADHPLVGIGYGEYTFIKRFGPMFDGLEDPPLYATFLSTHNTFLMVALWSGVPALVFLTWALVGAASSLVRGARLMADTHARPILIATAVMIAGFAARIFFDHMFMGSLASLFLIVMANGLTLSMSCQSAGVVPRAETQALCSGIPVQRSSNR